MVIPHRKLSIDINRPNHYTVDFIAHVGDKNTRYIDITFNADGEPIELEQGCSATVTYVSDGVLIEQEAECDVNGSTVIVGIDTGKVENLRSGILEIQPKIVDGSGNIIVSQIPVLVRISPDIAEHGRVDDDSLGTYAEVVREILAARGSYTNLKERLDHTGTPTDEQVAEAVEEYFDEHPISGAEKFVEVTDTSDTAVDNCTDPDTVYIVRVVSGVVTTTKMRVICTPNVAGQMAQYAMTKDGYIISRKFTASEWGAWDFIPDSKRVAAMISAAIAGKADSSAIPTKTSQLNNDSGFLTQHQDISGKADKSTTLAGYGITDSYTKSEVNSLVESGIVPDSAVVTAAVNNYLDNHPVDYSDEVSRTVDNIVEDLYSVENVSYESNDSILTLSNGYYNLNGEIVDHSAYKHTEKIKVIAGTTLQYSNLRAANNTLPCIACFANGVFSSALSYVPGNTDYASGTFQIPEGITAISLITREAANYPVSITIAEHKSRLTPLSEEVDSLEVISESLIAQKTIQLTSTDLSWESAYINKNGGITEHSKYHVSELIGVIEGTTLNFQNLRAPASGYPYLACYTSNDRTGYVSSKSLIATDSGFETGSLTVPQGIKYISVSIYGLISSSNPFLMEKDVSVNRVDELEDSMSKSGANHWSGKRWYAFGTSITDTNNSLGENGTPTGKYAPYLQQMSGMLLSNYGIAGGTIGSGGVHGGTSNILNKIKATDLSAADLITIEGFVNDFACSVPLGDIGDTENTSLYGALTQAVRHCLENSGATVVLITESIGRLYNEADYRTTRKNVINLTQNDYNEAIRNIGKFLGVPVIDAGGLAHINENRPKYLFDHIHHSELGGKQYANAIWSCLKNIPCSE